ncbi:MAG: hypothetical protein Unbinned5081contig1000_14 [Prokaryotic dsDNA virus sp.]|nr:MAG: hypothetical protein Unbinned5081contig1000_14 [Prokaryotic dsDNA virus sp.]|tara:strand:+ start:34229 stop:35149 length:921 start_codon:yes stop_codon:yes gene_type:complete
MGDRLTPIDLSWGNSSTFTTNVNTNFDDVATLLDSFLSRTDSTNANYMDVALDMNSNDINNAGTIRCDVLLIDNAQIPSLEDIQEAHADYLATLDASEAAVEASITATADAAETTINGYLTDAEAARDAAQLAETNAETAETGAVAAKDAAEAAAAGVSLPSITGGDAGKRLQVNGSEDGYELVVPLTQSTSSTEISGVSPSGDFTDGDIFASKVGEMVTVSFRDLAWTSASTAQSDIVAIGTTLAPDVDDVRAIVNADATGIVIARVTTTGRLTIECLDWTGAAVARTSVGTTDLCSISYKQAPF